MQKSLLHHFFKIYGMQMFGTFFKMKIFPSWKACAVRVQDFSITKSVEGYILLSCYNGEGGGGDLLTDGKGTKCLWKIMTRYKMKP